MSAQAMKIHPYDAYLLLTKLETITLIKKGTAYVDSFPDGQFVIDEVLYQEDATVPPTAEALQAIAKANNE